MADHVLHFRTSQVEFASDADSGAPAALPHRWVEGGATLELPLQLTGGERAVRDILVPFHFEDPATDARLDPAMMVGGAHYGNDFQVLTPTPIKIAQGALGATILVRILTKTPYRSQRDMVCVLDRLPGGDHLGEYKRHYFSIVQGGRSPTAWPLVSFEIDGLPTIIPMDDAGSRTVAIGLFEDVKSAVPLTAAEDTPVPLSVDDPNNEVTLSGPEWDGATNILTVKAGTQQSLLTVTGNDTGLPFGPQLVTITVDTSTNPDPERNLLPETYLRETDRSNGKTIKVDALAHDFGWRW